MRTSYEMAKEKLKDFTAFPSSSVIIALMEEYAQQWEEYPNTKPEYGINVLIAFENIHKDIVYAVAHLDRIKRYESPESPFDDRWFVFPSMGHEIHTVKKWKYIK
jgi:hypothetical protein